MVRLLVYTCRYTVHTWGIHGTYMVVPWSDPIRSDRFLFFFIFYVSFFYEKCIVFCWKIYRLEFFYFIYRCICKKIPRSGRPHFWEFFKVQKFFIDFRNLNFYRFFQGKVQVKFSLILEKWCGYWCIHVDTRYIRGVYMVHTW